MPGVESGRTISRTSRTGRDRRSWRLLELDRQRVEVALQHEDAERDGGGCVGEDQRPRRVEKAELDGQQLEQRDEEDDRREHLAGEEEARRDALPKEAIPAEGICRGRRQDDGEDRGQRPR